NRELFIEGEVVNDTTSAVEIPVMRATLNDAQGNELSYWLFEADAAKLEPGESARFETFTRNPPKDGANLAIAFSTRDAQSDEKNSAEGTGQ
ncbi:MAG: FxLYD domain-containing protein, partial [Kiloniellales bacterium]|nr:FxLYD domain-containing protein [Kiloniellales bacterium]